MQRRVWTGGEIDRFGRVLFDARHYAPEVADAHAPLSLQSRAPEGSVRTTRLQIAPTPTGREPAAYVDTPKRSRLRPPITGLGIVDPFNKTAPMILRQYTAAHERRSAVARFRESLQRCTGRRRNIALATLLIIASAGLLLGIVAAWLM